MDRGTRRRASIAVIAVAALASGPVPLSRAGTPWDGCPRGIGFYGDHVTVAEPPYGSNPPTSSSLAADPTDLTRLAVTNGRQVFASDDGGCTWADAFPASRPGQAGRVTVVAREGARTRAFVPVLQLAIGFRAHRLRLYLKDHGESTVDLPAEMPAEECNEVQRCLVRFAPGRDLLVAYAATPGVDGLLAAVGATIDGGKTWTVRPSPTLDTKAVPVDDLAIDPEDDAHIVAIAGRRLFGSRDRGETWTALGGPTSLSSAARVLFTDRPVVVDGAVYAAGEDGSFADTGVKSPGEPLRDVAYGPAATGHALVVAAAGGLYRLRTDGGFDTLLRNSAGVSQVTPTAGGLWVRRTGTLGFVDVTPGALDGPPPPPRPPRPGATPAGNLRGKADGGRLHVGGHVEVPPGGSAVTVVIGDLARQPRALDVFFLMDTSGSMASKVRPMALAMGKVVDALNREGVAARFGLGEYGDLSFRYRRHADLGTPPAEVQAKLMSLRGGGGYELQYTAFYQLATGEGMTKVTTGGVVAPGQQASFAPGALHVVIHATDDDDAGDPDGPKEPTAMAALNAVDARHIGIYPYNSTPLTFGTPYDHYQSVTLRRYAELTSTFAPVGGLDCEGDGVVDLHEGDPIACPVEGSTGADAPIATVLERVLLSLAAIQPVEVVVGASPLQVGIRALDDYSHIDLHEPHAGLEFRVQVQCPPAERGKRIDVPLHLDVGGVTVATAPLPVVCLAEPPEPPSPQPPAEEPPSPSRAAPRVVPGVPVVASAPTAVAQSTAQAASQATSSAQATQVGMAVAPDDALQVATEEEDDAHFVAYSRPAPSPVPAAAVLFATAVGLLYAVRPRVAHVRVREGRGPRW